MTLNRFIGTLFLIALLGMVNRTALAQVSPQPIPPEALAPDQVPTDLVFQVRDAIVRGLVYFSAREMRLDPDAVLIHEYLKDRFGLPELFSAEHLLAKIRRDTVGQLHKFLRLAEPVPFRPEFLETQVTSFDNITLAGMWYDKLPEPSILIERINMAPLDEPYTATHALWAIAMAQQCFDAELDTVMEHRLVEKVKAIMERTQPGWDDEAIEAMALAQYHDTTYVPPHGYIQELVNVQNPNGSWSWNQGQEVMGSQHTTVLALWALLQYKPLKWPTRFRPMVLRGVGG